MKPGLLTTTAKTNDISIPRHMGSPAVFNKLFVHLKKNYLMIKGFYLLSLLILGCSPLLSQEPQLVADTLRNNALNVFMNTSNYLRTEITFVNYVRDVRVADVYIISTYERSGSGGVTYKYFLSGQNRYEGMGDTIVVTTSPDDTEDAIRKKQVTAIKMGLMRYVINTPLASYFDIRFTQPVKETVESDIWNSWVFRTSMSGSLNGEKRYNSVSLGGSASANRITEKSKLLTSLSFNWSNQKYEMNDSTVQNSYSRSQSSSILYVKSLNDHWSAGISTGLSASSYGSYDLRFSLSPAIEYDIFPYTESTRRQLRLLYRVGYEYNNYADTTIYNKLTEHLGFQYLSASFELVQKWGSADFTLSYRNYFHDWSKNNFGGNLYLSLRVAKGLSVTYQGDGSIVNDQLSLPKGGISDTDILLRRRMTETKFSYYSYFGISYTFGSIYNNVVNPRFGN